MEPREDGPHIAPGQLVLVALAGLVAGAINTIAGAGSLITFPALLAAGLSPLQANVSNSIGLVPGSLSGAWGYRSELKGHLRMAGLLCAPSAVGAVAGAILLLFLPPRVFEVVVPLLVAGAGLVVLAQPRITHHLNGRGRNRAALAVALFLVGVYGGYFGAAQGIMLLAAMGLLLVAPLQRTNAFKTLIAGATNTVSGLIFLFAAPVSWPHALVLAVASTVGGRVGAVLARRIPDRPLRVGIGIIGLGVAGLLAVRAHLL